MKIMPCIAASSILILSVLIQGCAHQAILISRGVDEHDIESVSFGEDKPQCRESMLEACQAQNRRVNIILKR